MIPSFLVLEYSHGIIFLELVLERGRLVYIKYVHFQRMDCFWALEPIRTNQNQSGCSLGEEGNLRSASLSGKDRR